jgi:hypothetical protein
VANPEEIDLGEDDDVPDDDDEGSEPAAQTISAALAAVMQQVGSPGALEGVCGF